MTCMYTCMVVQQYTVRSSSSKRCLFVTYQIHKCVLKLVPAYLSSNFFSNSTFGYDCTRGRDKLHLIRPKTEFGKNSLQFKGVQLYNSWLAIFAC